MAWNRRASQYYYTSGTWRSSFWGWTRACSFLPSSPCSLCACFFPFRLWVKGPTHRMNRSSFLFQSTSCPYYYSSHSHSADSSNFLATVVSPVSSFDFACARRCPQLGQIFWVFRQIRGSTWWLSRPSRGGTAPTLETKSDLLANSIAAAGSAARTFASIPMAACRFRPIQDYCKEFTRAHQLSSWPHVGLAGPQLISELI